MGRLEDPEFTIKEALIITPYPGASAEEVAKEVTNPIESACQQLGQLKRVDSESSRGRSVVTAVIKDNYDRHTIPQVWDELRRKVADAQAQLPPSVRGSSMVIDDFGDVYGIFMAISGDGFAESELRRYAEFLRRELLQVADIKKVELFATQQEVVFLEISRLRLARLGINEEQIYRQLQAKNVVADGGRVRVGDEHIALDPTGGFNSAEEMLELVIGSDKTGRQLFLRDVATLERSLEDPPRRMLRYDGKPAIGLGISTVQGGNVVTVGEGRPRKARPAQTRSADRHRDRRDQLSARGGHARHQRLHVQPGQGRHHRLRRPALRHGPQDRLIIGLVLFLTIMATFMVMFVKGDLLMERISLGALIIALCMLTDNAIIVIEGIKVGIEAGEDKLEVVREVVAQNQWPLFGATAIGVIAFAAIGLSEDRTGEYCNSLFWVILISLSLSWVSSITVTPLLSYLSFKPTSRQGQRRRDPYAGLRLPDLPPHSGAGAALPLAGGGAVGAPVFGRTLRIHEGQAELFPARDPAAIHGRCLPACRHRTFANRRRLPSEVQQYIQKQPGVTHVTSFIGGGGLRFMLVYSPGAREPRLRSVPGRRR